MDIGSAMAAIKAGQCVRRAGWDGLGHIYLEKGYTFALGQPIERHYEPVISIVTPQGTYQPGWIASQADLLADDWAIIPFGQRMKYGYSPQYVFPGAQNST